MTTDQHPPDDLSFHGLTVSPERPVQPAEPLPSPASGFRFVRELGRGGMGVVYEAVEEATGRHVAVKIMARRLVHSPDAIRRFEREAHLAGSISHPNCVFVFGSHSINGAAAISMELMSGQSLEDRIRSPDPLPTETAVRWSIEILEGLDAAHGLGVIHRDVKPSNCFLTEDGHVKIGDFGLSRSLEGDVGLTQSGAFVGSPLYASPEQVRGREVDRRSDVYSAGATLYALLARRPPHSGSAIGDLLVQIVSEDPPALSEQRPGISRALASIVKRAMSKDPAKRFKDCAEFRRALTPHAPGSLTPATLGLRIVAYFIDYLFTSLLYQGGCIALYAYGMRFSSSNPGVPWMPGGMTSILGSRLVLFLWFSLLESRFEGSPAKRLLGLRVVRADGGRASLWRTTVRAAAFLGPLEAPDLIFGHDAGDWPSVARIVVYLIPLITMRKKNGYRGIHELVSGTAVLRSAIASHAGRTGTFEAAKLTPATGFPPVIGGYAVEGVVGSTERGPLLSARDPGLDRSVWIHMRGESAAAADPRPVSSAGLRWLRRGEDAGGFDVYEAPGGAPLRTYAESSQSVPWPAALKEIQSLTTELETRGGDVAVEQLWVDRWGHVRVLDFAIDGKGPRAPHEVLATAARSLMLGASHETSILPGDLPIHAEATVKRMIALDRPFESLAEARSALESLTPRPAVLTRSRRVAQVVLTGFWLLFVGLTIFATVATKASPDATRDVATRPLLFPDVAPFVPLVLYCIPSMVLAFAMRGSLTCALLGVRIRNRKGLRASRLRCALRAAVVCLPTIPALIALALPETPDPIRLLGPAASAALYLGFAICAVIRPTEGPADMIARTRLVRL